MLLVYKSQEGLREEARIQARRYLENGSMERGIRRYARKGQCTCGYDIAESFNLSKPPRDCVHRISNKQEVENLENHVYQTIFETKCRMYYNQLLRQQKEKFLRMEKLSKKFQIVSSQIRGISQ